MIYYKKFFVNGMYNRCKKVYNLFFVFVYSIKKTMKDVLYLLDCNTCLDVPLTKFNLKGVQQQDTRFSTPLKNKKGLNF